MTGSEILLPPGIPLADQYAMVARSNLFAKLEDYSRAFLITHPVVQKTYGWVQDPLHQWSRQWEYPFVLQYIARELNGGTTDRPEILDAGSGITFFPFYLKMRWPDASVTCCDYDNSLSRIYSQVHASLAARSHINFRVAPMQRLPFDDGRFSILYCVSVLEHTTDYLGIVREFHRVLRPGGLFLATFDISLDGVSEILPAEADHLHECILSYFQLIDPTRNPSVIPAAGVTSERIGKVNRALLPWRYPLLSMVKAAIKRRRVPLHWRKQLTVFCCSYRKPE